MVRKIVLDENTRVLAISIAIAAATLILSHAIYSLHADKIKELYSKIDEGKQKLVIRKDTAKLDNIIKEYKKYMHRAVNTTILRDTISALARDAGAEIVSMQPPVSERLANYTKVSFKVKLRASYNQLGKFIEKVESLGQLTKIDEIIIGEGGGRGVSSAGEISPEKDARVPLSLTISAYCVSS